MASRSDELLARARRTNADRDTMESEHGFAHPGQGDTFMDLRTAMSALECGMKLSDWDCIAEAYVMLETLVARSGPA